MVLGEIRRARDVGYVSLGAKVIWLACESCGIERWVLLRGGKPTRRLCRSCHLKLSALYFKAGPDNPAWKGGRCLTAKGYVLVRAPNHPRATANNGYVFEHILVMESMLGRYLLPGERPHHENENKSDNSPSNLSLMMHGQHTAFHWTGRHHTEASILKMSLAKRGKPMPKACVEALMKLGPLPRNPATGRFIKCKASV